jgi:hypothetical protein
MGSCLVVGEWWSVASRQSFPHRMIHLSPAAYPPHNRHVKMEMAAFAFRCFPKSIEIPPGLQDHPLEACQTSRRLADVLRKSGVRVLGDLHGRKVGGFAWERNCGFKTLHELDLLARHAQSWAENASSGGNGTLPEAGSSAFAEATADKPIPATAEEQQDGAGFAIPESVCHWQFDELPITTRLANIARSIGAQTLGDLNGRSALELLQCKDCGWRTLAEIQQLIERAISGEFDEVQMEESNAPAELLTLLERGMAKLSPRERQFLLARIGGLTFVEIGRRCALTRARAHQIVRKPLDTLRKMWGPRVPRLLEMVKRRCLSMVCPMTPALLAQWIGRPAGASAEAGESRTTFQLSPKAQVRLIAALDEEIPCWPDQGERVGGNDKFIRRLDLDLTKLVRYANGRIAFAEAYRKLKCQQRYKRLNAGEFLRMLRHIRRTRVGFDDPQIPVIRLRQFERHRRRHANSGPKR